MLENVPWIQPFPRDFCTGSWAKMNHVGTAALGCSGRLEESTMAGEILQISRPGTVAGESPATKQAPALTKYSLAVTGLLLLKRLLQILSGFVQGALGVVVGLQGLAVLVGGAFALSGDVEDLA